MKNSTIIVPYAEFSPLSENALKKIGFVFTEITLSKREDDWLVLNAKWKANLSECDVKYPEQAAVGFNRANNVSIIYTELVFSEIPAPYGIEDEWAINHKASIVLGIEFKHTQKFVDESKYDYMFKENTKYGVMMYFAPYSWRMIASKVIFSQK